MYQKVVKQNKNAADYIIAMERETISKNRVSSRKTTGVGENFFGKEELL